MRARIKCVVKNNGRICGRLFASYEKFDEHNYQRHGLKTSIPKKHYQLV